MQLQLLILLLLYFSSHLFVNAITDDVDDFSSSPVDELDDLLALESESHDVGSYSRDSLDFGSGEVAIPKNSSRRKKKKKSSKRRKDNRRRYEELPHPVVVRPPPHYFDYEGIVEESAPSKTQIAYERQREKDIRKERYRNEDHYDKEDKKDRKRGVGIFSSLMDLSSYFPFPFLEGEIYDPIEEEEVNRQKPKKVQKKEKTRKDHSKSLRTNYPIEAEKIQQQKKYEDVRIKESKPQKVVQQHRIKDEQRITYTTLSPTTDYVRRPTSDREQQYRGNNNSKRGQGRPKKTKKVRKSSISPLYAPIDWSESISFVPSGSPHPILLGHEHHGILVPQHGFTLPPPQPLPTTPALPPPPVAYSHHGYEVYQNGALIEQTAVSPYPIPPAPVGPPPPVAAPSPIQYAATIPAPASNYPVIVPNPVVGTFSEGKVKRVQSSQLINLPEPDYKSYDPIPRKVGSKVSDRFFSANIVHDLGISAPLQLLKVKFPNGAPVCLGNHLSFIDTLFEPSLNWNPVYAVLPAAPVPSSVIAKPAHVVKYPHPQVVASEEDLHGLPDPGQLFNTILRRTSSFFTQNFSHLFPRRRDDEKEEKEERGIKGESGETAYANEEHASQSSGEDDDASEEETTPNPPKSHFVWETRRSDSQDEETTTTTISPLSVSLSSAIEREEGAYAGGQDDVGDSDREPITSPTTHVISPSGNYSQAIDGAQGDIEKRDSVTSLSQSASGPPKRRSHYVVPRKVQPLYTVVMLDPDLSLVFGQFVHILRVNIPSPGKLGTSVTPYVTPVTLLPAISSPASPYHRYVFLVFAQTRPIDPAAVKGYLAKNYLNFKISEFARTFAFQKTPIAGNYFYGRMYVKSKVVC